MQDFSSTVSYSPSFSFYASSENQSCDVTGHDLVKADSVEDEDADFEFETSPLHEETYVHFPTFTPVSSETVLKSNKKGDDLASDSGNVRENIFVGGRWITPPSPLWSSENRELDNFSGHRLWSPLRSPAAGGGHSKISKRCRIKKFLTRSNSVSSQSESKRCCFKDFTRRSHSDGGDASKTSSPVAKGKDKMASYNTTNIGEGDKRIKSYLPYRQDFIGIFAGMRRLHH